jgi:hypothetical protein
VCGVWVAVGDSQSLQDGSSALPRLRAMAPLPWLRRRSPGSGDVASTRATAGTGRRPELFCRTRRCSGGSFIVGVCGWDDRPTI